MDLLTTQPNPLWVREMRQSARLLRTPIILMVLSVLVVLQFLFVLLTTETNKELRNLGSGLSTYVYQCLRFLTFNSEDKPYPFSDWPDDTLGSKSKKWFK